MEQQNRSDRPGVWTSGIGTAALALVATFVLQGAAHAQVTFAAADRPADGVADVTYAKDVAPIIQKNCTVCHRPGGIGPIDLVDYEDARRYARRIRRQVSNRTMPPYYYDRDIGIQSLKHDWRLSDEDITTIVDWVDQGTPLGDPADIPVLDLPDSEDWALTPEFGPPDLVIPSSPIDVPASGLDLWHRPFAPTTTASSPESRSTRTGPGTRRRRSGAAPSGPVGARSRSSAIVYARRNSATKTKSSSATTRPRASRFGCTHTPPGSGKRSAAPARAQPRPTTTAGCTRWVRRAS